MKKIMTVVTISVLAFVAVIFIVGLILPKQREFVKQACLKNPPEKVFKIVTDFQHQTAWRSDVREVKVIDDNTWTEIPKKGTAITFKTKRQIENQVFEIEIIEPKNFNGHWIGTFERTATNGTKVVFKEMITIENPFLRVLSSIFVDFDKTMELYLNDLKLALRE